jgi:protein-tyrosine phosphatase
VKVDKTFWIEAGRLAGRPGPNREPWDVETLYRGGIRAVLSVNDGEQCQAIEFATRGMAYLCAPMPDHVPPRPGDEWSCGVALERASAFIHTHLNAGRPVLVHCSSGKDRTGLVLAHYVMVRDAITPAQALARVRRVRPIALNAEGWEDLALVVLSRLR